jgi:peptidoglycan-associated lipoprotein
MKRLMFLLFILVIGFALAPDANAVSRALNVWEYPLDTGCLNTMLINDSRIVRVTAGQEYDDIVPCPPEPAPVVAVVEPTPAPVVPAAPVVVPEKKEPRVFVVHFDFDKSNIKASEKPIIDDAAAYIKENPEAGVVISEGHCDVRGSVKYNMALGMRRAVSVKQALIDEGVDPSIIEVISKGKSEPIFKLHWQNRRVQIYIK